MSINAPSDPVYNPREDFVESLLHHAATTRSHYPEPTQPELPEPVDQAPGPTPPVSQARTEPKTRLRKACDSCSARKVKCDEAGPPCRSCAALDIPCTFERPIRRRGPPNRHADAVKRQRLEPDGSWSATALSPTEDAAHSLASLSATQGLSAESICDIGTLQVLTDYYFTYVYPLMPLPHEPAFRASFDRREDRTNRSFLALLAAMIEVLVASFPRRSLQILDSDVHRRFYPRADVLIDRCHQVFNEARGIGYLDRELSVYDAFSSYLIGVSAVYTSSVERASLYFGECISIIHRLARPALPTDPDMQSHPGTDAAGQVNYILQELNRRLFWLSWGNFHSICQGWDIAKYLEISRYAKTGPPALPFEIDDVYIHEKGIDSSTPDVESTITAFNMNIRILQEHSTRETRIHVDMSDRDAPDLQRRSIGEKLCRCKTILGSAPKSLQITPFMGPRSSQPPMSTVPEDRQSDRQQDSWCHESHEIAGMTVSPSVIRRGIQKANVYATELQVRCSLVEKYWERFEVDENSAIRHDKALSAPSDTKAATETTLLKTPTLIAVPPHHRTSGGDDSEFGELDLVLERENIIRDLATYLQSVDQVYVEPIRHVFCHKIHEIASALLSSLGKRAAMPTLDLDNVMTYLATTLKIVTELENIGLEYVKREAGLPNNIPYEKESSKATSDEDLETRDLAEWAHLKDFQKFFTEGYGIEQGMM